MNVEVSIIIPTYNRPNTIRDVIMSYVNQEYLNEIIIIDDCSEKSYDEFNKFMNKICKEKNICYKYIKNDKKLGAAGARNKGLEVCNSEYILWGEDDLYLSENYTKVLGDKIDDKTILCGSIYYGFSNNITIDEIEMIKRNSLKDNDILFDFKTMECSYRKKEDKDVIIPFGHAIIMVPKNAYRNLRYFEEYKVNGYREETDIQILMLKNGYEIKYTSETECYHLSPDYIEKGGQHSTNKFIWEIFAVYNNCIFLNRHYDFLKEKFNINKSKTYMKVNFLFYRVKFRVKNLIKKFKI